MGFKSTIVVPEACDAIRNCCPRSRSNQTEHIHQVEILDMNSGPDDRELHALSSRFNIDILEEASYILWSIWKSIFPRYSTLPACIDALRENAELYSELRASHKRRGYDNIRNWSECIFVASCQHS